MRTRGVAILLIALLLALAAPLARAADSAPALDVYLFWALGCPHCERAMTFLERLEKEEPRLRVHRLEITRDARNRAAFLRLADRHRVMDPGVPFVVIGDRVVEGYLDDASTGAELRSVARECLASGCRDTVAPLLAGTEGSPRAADELRRGRALPESVRLPLLGMVSLRELSLPALTVVLGAVDGFNPCAMWTLVFLIGLLVGMPDRTRRWTLGVAFVAASALVYYLIMAAWLNALLFLGMVVWIRVVIGLVALAAGFYQMREFVLNKAAVCEVTRPERRRQVFERLRSLASERRFVVAVAGIVLLAFAVNVVELLCSAGIPAIYTQVLAMSALSRWEYHAYIALYILVFMLDDLVVFFTAMATLEVAGATGQYARYGHLVGGGVLLAVGALMLLRPEWLMFG
jgi:thiol-disulfide isomerase/thioredoxin